MRLSDKHVYHYDKVIVGNSLSALLCGYHTATPVLSLNPRLPLFFERFEPNVNLEFLGIKNESRQIQTNVGEETVGIEKSKVYRRLIMIMSMAGLLPIGAKAKSMRLMEEKKIRVVLDHARAANFVCENITVFGDNLLEPEIPPEQYMVLDWMNVRSGMVHPYDRISSDSDFVNCIHFYPSKRIDGSHLDKKDLVCVSYLTREQMENYEYSDTYARFEISDRMKALGIRGARNGRDPSNPERYKYYALKIESDRREAMRVPRSVIFEPKATTDSYLQYLTENL